MSYLLVNEILDKTEVESLMCPNTRVYWCKTKNGLGLGGCKGRLDVLIEKCVIWSWVGVAKWDLTCWLNKCVICTFKNSLHFLNTVNKKWSQDKV